MVVPPPTTEGWSELPELLLLSIVLNLSSLTDFFSFSAVCRNWRSFLRSSSTVHRLLSSRYLSSRPPLLLINDSSSFRFQSVGTDSSAAGLNPLLSPESLRHILLGYSYGHLLLLHLPIHRENHLQLILSDPFTGIEIRPPLLPRDRLPYSYHAATLTAPPSSSDSIILVLTPKTCVYHRLGSAHWSTHPFERPYLCISSIIPFNNQRVYAVNYKADTLIEFSYHGCLELGVKVYNKIGFALMGNNWKDSSKLYDHRLFGPQLAECEGELLLVLFVLNDYPDTEHIERIDVYRMDFQRMKWVQADYVFDEYALFIDFSGRCPVFRSKPERWGRSCNCVFVAGPHWNSWREFALEDGLLIPKNASRPFTYSYVTAPRWPEPIWVYPSFFF